MSPEDVTKIVEQRAIIEEAEHTIAVAKGALDKLFSRGADSAKQHETAHTPQERFDISWNAVNSLATELSTLNTHQRIAYTPAKVVTCVINGKPIDLSLRLRIFEVDGQPFELTGQWARLGDKNSHPTLLKAHSGNIYGIEETVFASVRNLPGDRPNFQPGEHREAKEYDNAMEKLANVESSIATYFASNRFASTTVMLQ